MFDVWIGDVNLAMVVLIFTHVVMLPVQLLLCFKVKRLVLRLLPTGNPPSQRRSAASCAASSQAGRCWRG